MFDGVDYGLDVFVVLVECDGLVVVCECRDDFLGGEFEDEDVFVVDCFVDFYVGVVECFDCECVVYGELYVVGVGCFFGWCRRFVLRGWWLG